MPMYESHQPGFPCWLDLQTVNLPDSVDFYSNLFGWKFRATGPGAYTMAFRFGLPVAGFVQQAPEVAESTDVSAVWSPYFSVADADAAAAKITEAGGTVVVEPTYTAPDGRFLIASDPSGVMFRCWEPRGFAGAAVMGETESLSVTELITDTADKAQFYASVFDLAIEPMGDDYALLKRDDAMSAGVLVRPDLQPGWEVYFQVGDLDGDTARAQDLGAEVLMPVSDGRGCRFSVLKDPQGAVFALINFA